MAEGVPQSAITLILAACGLSLLALFYLFQKHVSGQPLLAYESRRRVPWGPGVAALAMAIPALSVAAFFLGETAPPPESVSAEARLSNGWGNFVFLVGFVAIVSTWIASFYRAGVRDLGWPTKLSQFVRDVGIGIFATVSTLLPIYAIQLLLINAFQSDTQHPLVTELEKNHSPAMLLLGIAMAVVAAPLFEEFTFRCLLQGWLERREDEVLGYTATLRQPPLVIFEVEDSDRESDLPADPPLEPQVVEGLDLSSMPRPAHGWIPDLPHGWTPILLSGVAFGLAHVGHGVAPISLVLFGIVLGYLYQRTHRLVPCITAHMLFNGYSMLLLWLQLEGTVGS